MIKSYDVHVSRVVPRSDGPWYVLLRVALRSRTASTVVYGHITIAKGISDERMWRLEFLPEHILSKYRVICSQVELVMEGVSITPVGRGGHWVRQLERPSGRSQLTLVRGSAVWKTIRRLSFEVIEVLGLTPVPRDRFHLTLDAATKAEPYDPSRCSVPIREQDLEAELLYLESIGSFFRPSVQRGNVSCPIVCPYYG